MRMVINEALAHLEAPLRGADAFVEREEPFFQVVGHHSTLVHVVGNLLSNAIKFVAPGVRPQVQVRMELRDDWARLWVQDNGIGIPLEYQGRIFRVFERLHAVDAYPGTGVGLAIVRKGVERMGGRTGVDSEQGKGSHFWVDLPAAMKTGESNSSTTSLAT
jgi:signal transduction histidine kinase